MYKNDNLFSERVSRYDSWKNWVKEHGYIPSLNSPDENERKLATQIQNLILKLRKDTKYFLVIHDYEIMKSYYPSSPNVRKKRSPEENLEEIILWSKENNRLPKQQSQDEEERRLSYRLHLLISALRKHPHTNAKLLKDYEELKLYLKAKKGT